MVNRHGPKIESETESVASSSLGDRLSAREEKSVVSDSQHFVG